MRDIQPCLPEYDTRLLHLVRDADKLDIIKVVTQTLANQWHKKYPAILLDADENAPVTPELARDILEKNTASYDHLHSLADIHLMKIAWAYSIHYKPALQRLSDRKLLGNISESLPATPEIMEIIRRVNAYISDTLRG
jgi:hypothetical protein